MTEIKNTVVKSFDRSRAMAQVDIDGCELEFHSGCFSSGWPVRFPKAGDKIKVWIKNYVGVDKIIRAQLVVERIK